MIHDQIETTYMLLYLSILLNLLLYSLLFEFTNKMHSARLQGTLEQKLHED